VSIALVAENLCHQKKGDYARGKYGSEMMVTYMNESCICNSHIYE